MKLKLFNKKTLSRVTSLALATVMSLPLVSGLASCGDKNKRDNIVLMSEELSGLFNPFYATAGADMEVIGLTQIGMLSSDKLGQPVAGDEYATVVKDFKTEVIGTGEDLKTIYTFVIKNGLKFSDGKPLTMNDVFFNMYVLLDPTFDGISTFYSLPIEGLEAYRSGMDSRMNLILAAGADGCIGTTYNFLMPEVRAVYDAFRAGDMEAARKAQTVVSTIVDELIKYNVVLATKVILEAKGYDVNHPLYPMHDYTPEEKADMLANLQKAGLKL